MEAREEQKRNHVRERGFYLDVLACSVFAASQNVPERLPEPANAGPQAGGRRASWRGAAEHATQRSGRARSR